ncbi:MULTISPECIES: SDR family oxidoreductase [unclassified Nocardiopsis]|uniref:SDR family oxidoreductase n=1 Tax=Nocardiopsis TaxID=2013 RepID=UPI00387AC5B7
MRGTGGALGLDGRIALVTGGTRGLGKEIARKLCASGAVVLLNYLGDHARARSTARELGDEGGKVVLVPGDVSDAAGLDRVLDTVRLSYGRLDLFVHNAASFHRMPVTGALPEHCAKDMEVAVGPFLHGAGRLLELLPRGEGRVVAVSSTGSGTVVPGYVSLGMAKAALESLVRYLALEFAGAGIAVNAVAAGHLGAWEATAGERPPGGRTDPRDVAAVVALLCTPEAGALLGHVVTVDDGVGLLS